MNSSVIPLLARLLIAGLFLPAGIVKITTYANTTSYMAKLGFPMPEVFAILAMVIEVGGGLLLLIGFRTRWVAWLLALFVVVATFAAHRFWEFDAAQYNAQLNNFLKNGAVVGGLLMLAAFGPGRLSIDKS